MIIEAESGVKQPRMAGNHQKLGRGQEGFFEPSEGAWP